MVLWILLACLAALNVRMTRRVWNAGEALEHKGMVIASIWLMPLFGLFVARSHIKHYTPRNDELVAPGERDPESPVAPRVVQAPGAQDLVIEPHLMSLNGMPVLDWQAVEAWLDTIAESAARQQARTDCQRAWLLHLRDALGSHFRLHESEQAFVLSSLEDNVAAATSGYVARTRQRIARILGPLARLQPGERSLLIVFDDEEAYYTYTSGYEVEAGEFAFSGGMFVDAGCPHFVTRRADLAQIEPVIAHELTHSAVSHLRLPLWLDEGIAVNTEYQLTGRPRGRYTPHQLQDMHERFWGEAEIQQFWSGASFRRPDEGNPLSYELARIVVEKLSQPWQPFAAFVAAAQRADGGASAAAEHLDVELGAFVCALLRRSPESGWAPQVTAAADPS